MEEDIKRFYSMELLIIIMLVLMLVVFFASRFYVVIPAGYKGTMYKTFQGGTVLNGIYYDEGFHLVLPWDKMILYETRVKENQDTISALTQDGLQVIAEISYRYFPDYERIGLLHKELGPDYLETIIVPHITAITRDVISHYRVDKLYSTSRDSNQIDMTHRSQKQITDNYPLIIMDIVVRNIVLPTSVEQAISKKLVMEQEMLEYDFKLALEEKEALRKEIEARGIREFIESSEIDILKWEGINACLLYTSPSPRD